MRALIVDDSSAMRRILSRMLEGLGFEVAEASNGAEGLKKLEGEGSSDLALVDWNMPVMNGYEFLQKVRSNPDYSNMRVMMVTTETGTEEMVKALEAGADEYVMKPFTKTELVSKLDLLGLNKS